MLVLIVWKALNMPFIDHSYTHCIRKWTKYPVINNRSIDKNIKYISFRKYNSKKKKRKKWLLGYYEFRCLSWTFYLSLEIATYLPFSTDKYDVIKILLWMCKKSMNETTINHYQQYRVTCLHLWTQWKQEIFYIQINNLVLDKYSHIQYWGNLQVEKFF